MYYFITSRTHKKRAVFESDEMKKILLHSLKAEIRRASYDLIAWVILKDHYHLLLKVRNAEKLPQLMQKIHGGISYRINKMNRTQGTKLFHNYWDHCIRDEADFWKHFNYIHHNPIKHDYVNEMQDYDYSSFNFWLEKKRGQEWLNSCFRIYPIIDFTRE